MFFGNPQLLERSLHNDLNTFIKNIKAREDQHLTLLQYNKAVILQLSQVDTIPFLQEEISKHKSFYASVLDSHQKLQQEEQEIITKYVGTVSEEPSILKLMGRVTARVLEICQASLDKSKFLDDTLCPRHLELKKLLLGYLNDQSIQVESVLAATTRHVEKKNIEQMRKLSEIIRILSEGDLSRLGEVYQIPTIPKQEPRKVQIEVKQVKKSPQKPREKDRQSITKKVVNSEAVRKEKSKLVSRIVTTLYNTMEISKQQLTEDMIFRSPEEQRKKLYDDIMWRNRLNLQQILTFEAKRDDFQRKVKEFKEKMEKESQRIEEVLVVARFPPVEDSRLRQDILHSPAFEEPPPKQTQSKAAVDDECEIIMPEKDKLLFRRKDKRNFKAPSPRKVKQAPSCSMQSTQQGFQHIKFEAGNQQVFARSNRAKLPQISGRSSLDNRYEKIRAQQRGRSDMKDQKRINIVKNIDIGNLANAVAKNCSASNEVGKTARSRSPGPVLFDMNGGGLNQMTGGFDFTFYAWRKGVNKLGQNYDHLIL